MARFGRAGAPMRIVASAVIVTFVGLQLLAIARDVDDWPFASNAMFSFRRTGEDPVYDLRLEVEVDGRWRLLHPPDDLGDRHGEAFRRVVFSDWYGSSDPEFPQRGVGDDDPEQFAGRFTILCGLIADEMAERGRQAVAMRVTVVGLEVHDGQWVTASRHAVGECDPIRTPFRLAGH